MVIPWKPQSTTGLERPLQVLFQWMAGSLCRVQKHPCPLQRWPSVYGFHRGLSTLRKGILCSNEFLFFGTLSRWIMYRICHSAGWFFNIFLRYLEVQSNLIQMWDRVRSISFAVSSSQMLMKSISGAKKTAGINMFFSCPATSMPLRFSCWRVLVNFESRQGFIWVNHQMVGILLNWLVGSDQIWDFGIGSLSLLLANHVRWKICGPSLTMMEWPFRLPSFVYSSREFAHFCVAWTHRCIQSCIVLTASVAAQRSPVMQCLCLYHTLQFPNFRELLPSWKGLKAPQILVHQSYSTQKVKNGYF